MMTIFVTRFDVLKWTLLYINLYTRCDKLNDVNVNICIFMELTMLEILHLFM